MSDTPCEFGCTRLNEHHTGCTCTAECADHPGHCKGCLPRDADIGSWCRRDYDHTKAHLWRLPELVADLASAEDGRIAARSADGSDSSRRATKVDQASPSPAFDLADEASRWALHWAEAHADTLGHVGPFVYDQAGIPSTASTRLIAYLAANLPTIAEADYSHDFATELRGLIRTCELAAGQDRLVHRMKSDRCPRCDRKSLTREDGADSIVCHNPDCRGVWREDEYPTLIHWSTQTGDPAPRPEAVA